MDVDIAPLLEQGIQILTMVLLAVGGVALRWISKKFKLQADSEVRAYLHNAIYNGIELGMDRLQKEAANVPPVQMRKKVMGEAANYVIQHVPDARKHFGLTNQQLLELIESRAGPILRREEERQMGMAIANRRAGSQQPQ